MKQPVLFLAHGSPMNALYNNSFTNSLKNLGNILNSPKTILMISAHWISRGKTFIHNTENPPIIYDFGGFPKDLYEVKYPVHGSIELAQQVIENIQYTNIEGTREWGIDHGAWSVLKHMFPKANIPVVQLSIDFSQPPQFHFELGESLSFLREQNVLIIGSGNLIHNLRTVDFQNKEISPSQSWVNNLDISITQAIESQDYDKLLNYYDLPHASLGINNPDHYLPFLYTLGAGKNGIISYPYEGYELGTLDMRCVRFD